MFTLDNMIYSTMAIFAFCTFVFVFVGAALHV